MKTQELREELFRYIKIADENKIRAIYTLLKEDIQKHNTQWEDTDFIKGLEESVTEYESSRFALHSWEEIKANLEKG